MDLFCFRVSVNFYTWVSSRLRLERQRTEASATLNLLLAELHYARITYSMRQALSHCNDLSVHAPSPWVLLRMRVI